MKLKTGFSLVELMVTVAIIAVLAAIAIPSYKRYIVTARFEALVPMMDGLVQQAITYANVNGHFPSLVQLTGGTGSTTSVPGGPQGTILEPDGAQFYFWQAADISTQYGATTPCGMAGQITFQLDGAAFGLNFTAQPEPYISITCLMANKNSVVNTKCFYTYSQTARSNYRTSGVWVANSPASGSGLIPGMTNMGGNVAGTMQNFFAGTSCINS